MLRASSSVLRLPQRYPFAFGVAISSAKTGAADYMAQTVIKRRERFDYRRSLVFFLWGAGYLGMVQYFLYVQVFARTLFPSAAAFAAKPLREKLADRRGQVVMLSQVGIDQFLHHPFVLFPCFYSVKELVESKGERPLNQVVSTALHKYRKNLWEDCLVCWRVWVPTFVINFSFCPLWARVPFVACISFGFTTYWSFLRGNPIPEPELQVAREDVCGERKGVAEIKR